MTLPNLPSSPGPSRQHLAPSRLGLALGVLVLLGPLRLWAQNEWLEDEQGCKHMRGWTVLEESTTWTGGCVDGFAAGPGVQRWWHQGKLVSTFTGTKAGGKATGQGRLESASGLLYEGEFSDGLRQGQGRMQWPDGMRYVGEFAANQFQGAGELAFGNGHRYQGRFEQGQLQGEARVNWPEGQDPRRLERLLNDGAPEVLAPPKPGQKQVSPKARMTPACTPSYPKAALREDARGSTGLAMLVDENGQVSKVRIVQSSGDTPAHKLLDLVAATSIWNCPFTAGALDGKPSPLWVKIYYEWRIE